MISNKNSFRLNSLTFQFALDFYGNIDEDSAPSYDTVRRTVLREGYTRKVLTRLNGLVDNGKRLDYYRSLNYIHYTNFFDIDEMSASPKEFFETYGWAPEGEDAYQMQIKIGNHNYTVIAAYGYFGFICWQIFKDECIDAIKFQDFLTGRVKHSIDARAEES